MIKKSDRRLKRRLKIRKAIFGQGTRPRLSVFRSGKHIYGQIIDDERGYTLVAFSDLALPKSGREKVKKQETAFLVGMELAKKSAAKQIKEVVFDRGGFRFFGRIKALAEGARKGGLVF